MRPFPEMIRCHCILLFLRHLLQGCYRMQLQPEIFRGMRSIGPCFGSRLTDRIFPSLEDPFLYDPNLSSQLIATVAAAATPGDGNNKNQLDLPISRMIGGGILVPVAVLCFSATYGKKKTLNVIAIPSLSTWLFPFRSIELYQISMRFYISLSWIV